jgi:cell division septation protein DedD
MAWGILPAVKERLTGAVILVALMVLLVPELLTGPIRTKSLPAAPANAGSSPATATGPASPGRQPPLRTYTLTLGSASSAHGSAAAPAVQPGSAASTPEVPPSPAQEPTQSVPAKAAGATVAAPGHGRASQGAAAPRHAAARTPAPRPAPTAARTGSGLQVAGPPAHRTVRHAPARASSSGRWVVQLGVFAEHRNAVRLASLLGHRGFRVSVSPVRVRSRVLWRVSTAPPQARAAALHLAARLRAAGHRGDVLPVR